LAGKRVTTRSERAETPPQSRASRAALALLAVSAALLGIRLYASTAVGFGDSEALYAAYAGHPQPAYLDHPGLVGVLARAIGGGAIPSPERAHAVTAVLATLFPWIVALACLACGAPRDRSFATAFVVALVPEMAIGLFALTPDLLLASSWMGAVALAAMALRAPAGHARAALSFAGAGVLAGVAAASKMSGLLLFVALVLSYMGRAARAHARTLAPWAGLAAGAILLGPVVIFEARTGWPMLAHRLIDTQSEAGVSIRNAAAVVFGQLVYLSPLVAWLAAGAARSAWRQRDDAVGTMLFAAVAVPACVLLPLCLWSRVAEPHWIAPALLALAPAAARARTTPSRRTFALAASLAAAMVAAVHAWVLIPAAVRLAPPSAYDARIDLTNELYGWPDVARAVRTEVESLRRAGSLPDDVVVVAPHWVLCAQLEVALHGDVAVGCDTPVKDDFDDWFPRARWRAADAIIWVTDARFGPPPDRHDYAVARTTEVRTVRAGYVVRVFQLSVLSKMAVL
jgi:hypothetical protein